MTEDTLWRPEQLEPVPACGLCGSTDSKPLATRPDGIPMRECAACGFAYLSPRPTQEALAGLYNNGYFNDSSTYQDYYNYAQAMADASYCPRLRRMGRVIPDWDGKNVLDIGCAAGGTLAVLRDRGATVSGIEISEEAVRVARNEFNLDVACSTVEDADLGVEAYDAVLAFDVMEHLPSPGRCLEAIAAALKPGGWFAVTIPNFDRFAAEGDAWPGVVSYWEHLGYFKSAVLAGALERLGLFVADMHTYTAGLDKNGNPERQTLRRFCRSLRRTFPFLSGPLRAARKMKYILEGYPEPDVRQDGSGMDLYILSRKDDRSGPKETI